MPSCESQSELRCSALMNLTAALVELEETFRLEVKVTELCEPTGDVMYK